MTTPEQRAELDDLVDRYCDGVIRRDADTWASTWAPDGEWDLGRGPVSGRDAIVEAWTGAMTMFDWVVQTAPLRIYDVEPGAAAGTGRVTTSEQFRTADGTRGSVLGTYHDTYVRTDAGWRFGSRRLTIIDYNVTPPPG